MSISQHAPTSINVNNLPPAILGMFAPRKPLPFLPPLTKKKHAKFDTVSRLLDEFETPDEDEPTPFY